jgi:hypothetical protein
MPLSLDTTNAFRSRNRLLPMRARSVSTTYEGKIRVDECVIRPDGDYIKIDDAQES